MRELTMDEILRELTMDEILVVAGGADADRQAPNDGSRGNSAAENLRAAGLTYF